jgi:DNA-binding IclR family transcriptional regulator
MPNKSKGERPTTSAVIRRRGKDVVKSAGRSLEVLELLRDARKPLRLTDIASALNLPQSSASMLIRSLISMGYLIRQDRSYAPSMRITLLGNWLNDAMFSQGNLMSLIQEISHLTGDTVILATRNSLFVEVLAVVPGRMESIHHTRPGDARPLTRAVIGHVILSAMNRQEAEALVLRINAEQKRPERRVKFQSLVPMLDRIRQNGYGYAEGTIPNGANVAMLLPSGPFGDTLVVGNAGTIARIHPRREEILGFMRATIRKYLRDVR